MADLVHGEGVFVLAHRQQTEGDGKVSAGQDGVDTVEGFGGGGVDGDDTGVRLGGAEDLPVEHPRIGDVVHIPGCSRRLGEGVHPGRRLTDDSATDLGAHGFSVAATALIARMMGR